MLGSSQAASIWPACPGGPVERSADLRGSPLRVGLLAALRLVSVFVLLGRRAGRSGSVGGLGRSRARRYDPTTAPRVTFDKVAGIDEVEDEVVEIVDFLPWAAGHPPSP
jgi:ATP-dependent Zn protease